jgi:arylsulfatase A-like enzyme
LWEGGIKVPAFVRWPGKIKPGSETKQVVTTMDWSATILAVGNGKPRQNFPLDGIDVMPFLTEKSTTIERTLYWRVTQRAQQKAVRIGEWKYLKDEKGEYLFHIGNDESEKDNLKDQKPEIFDHLKSSLEKWERTVLTAIPL